MGCRKGSKVRADQVVHVRFGLDPVVSHPVDAGFGLLFFPHTAPLVRPGDLKVMALDCERHASLDLVPERTQALLHSSRAARESFR